MSKHTSRAHAPLPPSGGKRWIECPASYVAYCSLASDDVLDKPSEAAKEGTLAHEWAERLRNACMSDDPNVYAKELATLENRDEEMAFHCDNYIDFLDNLKHNFQNDKYDEYEEYLEKRVRFTDNIWGTLDYGCARRKKKGKWQAIIADFKYGRGVYVPVKDNVQLIIYLIALEEYIGVRFEKAWIYIYQPRIPKDAPFERATVTWEEITEWRKKILKAEKRCLDMQSGAAELKFKAGDHCQFCPFQPQCPTFKDYAQSGDLKILDNYTELPQVDKIPIEALVELHHKKKQIEHFLENVDHYLLMRGINRMDIGDLKIVEGRSNRRWLEDETEVANGLRELGVQPYTKKLITIGAVEKKVGKNQIDHLTTKPPGKLQLASQDDKRQIAQFGNDSIALLD